MVVVVVVVAAAAAVAAVVVVVVGGGGGGAIVLETICGGISDSHLTFFVLLITGLCSFLFCFFINSASFTVSF